LLRLRRLISIRRRFYCLPRKVDVASPRCCHLLAHRRSTIWRGRTWPSFANSTAGRFRRFRRGRWNSSEL